MNSCVFCDSRCRYDYCGDCKRKYDNELGAGWTEADWYKAIVQTHRREQYLEHKEARYTRLSSTEIASSSVALLCHPSTAAQEAATGALWRGLESGAFFQRGFLLVTYKALKAAGCKVGKRTFHRWVANFKRENALDISARKLLVARTAEVITKS